MKIKEYRLRLRQRFFEALDQKTGWGKNEIKEIFRDVEYDVLSELIEEKEVE